MNILVLGLGQSLRGDDAAGLEAVRLWQKQYPDNAAQALVEISELPGLDLLEFLEGQEAAILVDTLLDPSAGGTLRRIGPDELSSFTTDTQSAHGWGVAETLALGRSLYPALADCRITLIGIAGSQFEMGAGISPAVRAALSQAAALIEKEVQSLLDL